MHTFTLRELIIIKDSLIGHVKLSTSEVLKDSTSPEAGRAIEEEIVEAFALRKKVTEMIHETLKADIIFMDELKKIYSDRGKIPAVKALRAKSMLSLGESKEFIENLCETVDET